MKLSNYLLGNVIVVGVYHSNYNISVTYMQHIVTYTSLNHIYNTYLQLTYHLYNTYLQVTY